MKATVSGATTTYVGNPSLPSGQGYFEWVSSTNDMNVRTRYYYAGATRVPMRTGPSTLNYLLGDHLGSQAITTNSSGVKSAVIRYMPWGTERYNSGTTLTAFGASTPTTYKFTGQRYESLIGLYFYNSRWYDPSAGRFLQADSVVPDPGNSSSFDRYSYVGNNPIRYIDPTGHRSDCTEQEIAAGDETCEENYSVDDLSSSLQYLYGWNIVGDWTVEELITLIDVAMDIITYINEITSGGGASWFREVMGDININRVGGDNNYVLGNTVNMTFSWVNDPDNTEIFAHELAHVWDNRTATMFGAIGATWYGGGAADEFNQIRWRRS